MNKQWKMARCIVDFERAIINSFRAAIPDVDINCCWYRYLQALWRKYQKLGFTTVYETDPMVNNRLKYIMATPLISKGMIHDGLQLFQDTVPSTNNQYYKFIK